MIDNCSRAGRGRALVAICLMGLSLGACASKKLPVPLAGIGAAEEDEWGLEHTRAAIAHLNAGEPDKARARLVKALKEQPGDMIAQSLLKQIDTDPQELLGAESHAYKVQEGETLSVLAQRFLGDPLLSYALARYNGLSSPMVAVSGQTIRVPGKAKAPPKAKKPASEAAKRPKPANSATAAAPAAPAKPAANPARAAKLRGQGLAAMNSGAIDRAVGLLRQALSLDPGNGAIRSDLARAMRIQGTVKGRP